MRIHARRCGAAEPNDVLPRPTKAKAVAALTALALVGGACGSSSNKSSSATTAAPTGGSPGASSSGGGGTPYKVAIVGDLSGAFSEDGIAGVGGIETAIDVANASGGVNGKKIDFGTPIDAMSTPTSAVSAAQQAIASNPLTVLGATFSSDVNAMTPSFNQSNTPFISDQGVDPLSLPTPKPWFWTTSSTSAQQALLEVGGMKAMLGGSLQGKKIAFALLQSTSVATTGAAMKSMLQQDGATVVTTQYTASGQASSFSSQAENIAAAHPDGVITVDSDPNTILEVKALRTAGFNGPVTASTGANDDVTLKTVGDPNFFVPRTYNTINSSSSMSQAASQAGTTSKATNAFFSQGYAAGLVLIAALKKCGVSCTQKSLPAAVDSIGSLDIGDLGFGPLQFTSSRNYGVTAVQFFVWDSSSQKSTPKFSPISV